MSRGPEGPALPLRHFATAAAAFWLFAAAFLWGHSRLLGFDFDARWVLGLVHLLTLGWLSMTIFGALTQMLPAYGLTTLAAPGAARAAWWLLTGGLAGFVAVLWSHGDRYWVPGCALVTAVGLYLYSLARTLWASHRLDWTARHLAAALAWLSAVATVGLLLAWDRQRGILFRDPQGALIAHVHMALIGWASLTIIGVSNRLVASVSETRMASPRPGQAALLLLNVGLAGLALDGLFGGRRWLPVWAVLLTAGWLAYAFQLRRLPSAGLDPSSAFVGLAAAGGAVWCALGLGLAFGWITDTTEARAAYIFTALLGWATPWILAQAHKIVPTLVWLMAYRARAGGASSPAIGALADRRLAWLEFAAMLPVLPLGLIGFLTESPDALRGSAVCLFLAATAYGLHTLKTMRHLWRADPVANSLHITIADP